MRWIVVVLGVAGVLALLAWLAQESDARRGDRVGMISSAPVAEEVFTDEQENAREEEDRIERQGVVVDEAGKPIGGATLSVEETLVRATSDAEGRFRLRMAPTPYAAVNVHHAEYVDTIEYFSPLDTEQEVRITLLRGARYRLRVVGRDRKPVAGARVTVTREQQHGVTGMWGWSQFEEISEGATDESGEYDLGVLALGAANLLVEHERFANHRENLDIVSVAAVDHDVVLSAGGAVEGVVTGPAGKPIAGARVFTEHRDARTDEVGRFRVERIGAGPSTVSAEMQGYGPGFFGEDIGWDEPVPVQVVAGETITNIAIRLGPAAWVEGRVVDEKGAAVPGASVNVWAWGAFQVAQEFKSDDEGRFFAGPFNVTEERASVQFHVEKERFTARRLPPRHLKPGERIDIGEVVLKRAPVLRGKVVDAEGRGVANCDVTAHPSWAHARSGPDGKFEIVVAPGPHLTLQASVDGRESKRSQRLLVGDARTGIVLTLRAALSIRGNVTDGEGNPRGGVALIARSLDVPQEVRGQSAEWAHTSEQGDYEVSNLSPGRYKIGVVGSSGGYFWHDAEWVHSANPREVAAGDENVDFDYPRTGGIVTARVVSRRTGRPIRNIRFGLIRFRMLLPRFVNAGQTQDPEGKFRVELDQEGSWAIDFQADGHAPYRTPRFSLKKGETKDLGTIRLGSGATLVGQVRDAQGMAVPYARINVLSPKFETNDNEPFTGRDGRFRIEGIAPGLYTVFAVSPRHPIGMVRNLSLREDEEREVEIRFVRSAPLELIVKDDSGQPIAGADLSWSFPAIAPLSSRLFRDKIPPGYGSHKSDATGRIFQHSLPAGPVALAITAQGFKTVAKQVRLTAGETKRIEIEMVKK